MAKDPGDKCRYSRDFNLNEKIDDAYGFVKTHPLDSIAYALLIIGLITFFFKPYLGLALVGIVVGIYFSTEILDFFKSFNDFLRHQGTFRVFVLGGALLVLLLAVPMFFVGAALAVALKALITNETAQRR
jgi:hypothetical protein